MTTRSQPTEQAEAPAGYSATNSASLEEMPLTWIEPSPLNPRRRFSEESLQELAESIRTHGLLEPLVVRPIYRDNDEEPRYIIIAGERRYRAARMAGLQAVPVRILTGIDERKHLELALLENLQRQDLDPLEEAAGYKALAELGYTQGRIAAAVHRSQPSVAKALSLLQLPPDVAERISTGELTPTHGQLIAARFRAWPKVASATARLAAEQRYTTARLEEMVNLWWQLSASAGGEVVRALESYQTVFDTTVCQACPYGANMDGHCLKPEHYDELQLRAQVAEKERAATVLKTAKAEGKKLPKLDKLKYGDYERIYSASSVPSGCSAECPCRGHALDSADKSVDICTDPKRYHQLREAEQKEKKRLQQEQYAADLARLHAQVDGAGEIGVRELVVILAAALGMVDAPVARGAAKRHAPALVSEKMATHEWRTTQFHQLAELDPMALVRFAVEAVVHKELHRRLEYGAGYTTTPLFDWYTQATSLSRDQLARITKLEAKMAQTNDGAERAALARQIEIIKAKGANQSGSREVEANGEGEAEG